MGLKTNDLKGLIYHIFEIDAYKSKMGSDENVVTLSFSSKTKDGAEDLMSFIEKGYGFVLDSDVPAGEQRDGTYAVFVEIERNNKCIENIMTLLSDLEKLTGIKDFKFRYYKNWRSVDATEENMEEFIPTTPQEYKMVANDGNLNNYKNFFSKSYVESVDVVGDIIRVTKHYAPPLYFKFKDFGNKTEILESVKDPFNYADFGEVLFLTKYFGDYSISKYGSNLFFEHQSKILVAERIEL